MNFLKLTIIIFLSFILVAFCTAQSGGGIDAIGSEVLKILGNIIRFLFSILMLVSSALLIFLGIRYIANWGKPEELHKSILYVIVGIVLLVLSLFLPNLIKNFIEQNI